MKKLIKIDFNNTTKERKTEDSLSELYSYDKNNGSFEFEILNDTLTTEQVIALFKFTESNKVWKTTGAIEGNKVKVTFDTTLITQNETVICYLYFDEEQRTSDTFRFKFKVKVSEIDKMSRYEVKERFINDTVIVDRLDVVTKDELKEALKNVSGIATEGLLTEVNAEELYAKKSDLPTPYNDSALVERVTNLENKTDNDTVYDDTPLKQRVEALETKVDKDTVYNDEEVKQRLTVLENKPTVDTSHFITDETLDSKNYLTTTVAEETYAKKSEIPQPYNDSPLNERVTALENRPSTGGDVTSATSSEIRGTGMPNGVVEAPIGATYIDTAKTNGALKWIKTTDGGNTGWKVVEGDTGWITIFQGIVWRDFVNRLMIRRINNTVNIVFEGLGDVEGIFFDKTAYPHNLDLVNVKVTDGFKPVSRITLPALNYASFYDEDGVFTIGTITFDVIDGMFKITLFSEQDRVGKMENGLANINFNYVTYEGWPTELPGQN